MSLPLLRVTKLDELKFVQSSFALQILSIKKELIMNFLKVFTVFMISTTIFAKLKSIERNEDISNYVRDVLSSFGHNHKDTHDVAVLCHPKSQREVFEMCEDICKAVSTSKPALSPVLLVPAERFHQNQAQREPSFNIIVGNLTEYVSSIQRAVQILKSYFLNQGSHL